MKFWRRRPQIGQCRDCQHWESHEGDDYHPGFGTCDWIVDASMLDHLDRNRLPAYISDGQNMIDQRFFITRPDFGCYAFKPQVE